MESNFIQNPQDPASRFHGSSHYIYRKQNSASSQKILQIIGSVLYNNLLLHELSVVWIVLLVNYQFVYILMLGYRKLPKGDIQKGKRESSSFPLLKYWIHTDAKSADEPNTTDTADVITRYFIFSIN